MAIPSKDFDKLSAKVIVRAWKDPRFKEKLLKNPRAAFKEMGLDLPEKLQVKVQEDKENTFTFVLPSYQEKMGELSDRELELLAAGAGEVGTGIVFYATPERWCRDHHGC